MEPEPKQTLKEPASAFDIRSHGLSLRHNAMRFVASAEDMLDLLNERVYFRLSAWSVVEMSTSWTTISGERIELRKY